MPLLTCASLVVYRDSRRATAATRLYASGVDEQLVMERTGHRSIEGIRSYKRTSSKQQEAVSDLLTNPKRICIEGAQSSTEVVLPEMAVVSQGSTVSSAASESSTDTSIDLPSSVASKTFNSTHALLSILTSTITMLENIIQPIGRYFHSIYL